MVAVLVLLAAIPSAAQVVRDIRLYSEWQRIGPHGEWVAMDRGEKQTRAPREILSPGVGRGGYLTVQVAISADPKSTYFLAVQSNPENVFQWKVYKASFEREGGHWAPAKVTEDREPYFNVAPDSDARIEKQTTQIFVVDVFVPASTEPGRKRLEVLVKSDTWRVAPMEVRVLPVTLPATEPIAPAVFADFAARNRKQTEAYAATVEPAVRARCDAHRTEKPQFGAEWFLRLRDCLFAAAAQ
ncbi:MAG: hypothetical protein JNK48_25735 [Bryobacterales bacterium]|nr:hypothetical protein [Bryobacterales bacterium]